MLLFFFSEQCTPRPQLWYCFSHHSISTGQQSLRREASDCNQMLLWLYTISHCETPHTSQRTMGKSTWMQGWSSFTIPWKVRSFPLKMVLKKHYILGTLQPSSPEESDFSGSSLTWTFFCHFSSPPSPRRTHGRGRRPRHNTGNCRDGEQTSKILLLNRLIQTKTNTCIWLDPHVPHYKGLCKWFCQIHHCRCLSPGLCPKTAP